MNEFRFHLSIKNSIWQLLEVDLKIQLLDPIRLETNLLYKYSTCNQEKHEWRRCCLDAPVSSILFGRRHLLVIGIHNKMNNLDVRKELHKIWNGWEQKNVVHILRIHSTLT